MREIIDRRGFLKSTGAASAGIALAGLGPMGLTAAEVAKGVPNAEKLGWRLGCMAYSFRAFSFYEAIDKNASLGLRYIEGFAWQKLSKEKPDVQTNESMPANLRKELKKKLGDAGTKLVACYIKLSADEADCRKKFEYAKDLGIETFVGEPPPAALDVIEKFCEEYQVNLAIHNHAGRTPEDVLKMCTGRSKRIGACPDTGHWARTGLNTAESVKKLEGRLITFHIKDIDKFGVREAHDVILGTGKADIKGILTECYRQRLKAFFSIEYESNWLNNVPDIAQCVAYFDKVADQLAAG